MNRFLLLVLFLFSVAPALNANGVSEYSEPNKGTAKESKKDKKKNKIVRLKRQIDEVPMALSYSTYEDYCEGNGYNVFDLSLIYYTRPNRKWWELNEYKVYVPEENRIEDTTYKTFAVQIDSILYVNMWHYKFGRTYKRVKVMPDGSLMFVNAPVQNRHKNYNLIPIFSTIGGGFGGVIGGAIAGAIVGGAQGYLNAKEGSSESNMLEDQFCYVLDPLSKEVKLVNDEILLSILAGNKELFDSFKTPLQDKNYSADIVMQVLYKAGIISKEDIPDAVSAEISN